MNVETKLNACINARAIASRSLAAVLRHGLTDPEWTPSEVQLRDAWLAELRKCPQILPDGWYAPPPGGIGMLFATETIGSRINYDSLRPEGNWPQDDVRLDRQEGMAYVYASPVHKKTGIIGDFGMTIYLGKVPEIIEHLQNCLRMNRRVFDHLSVGMTLAEISDFASDLFKSEGLSNNVTSVTDLTGVNIGHTVPASYEHWTPTEIATIKATTSGWEKIISGKRIFVNGQESFRIIPAMALTIEPRLTVLGSSTIPMSSFHTIIVIHGDGSKELLTNFSNVFAASGMRYMEKA